MQEIRLHNNLTRQKEILRPLEPGHVRMYACGVTVYDHCHIGHAMQAIFFDVIRNYLEYAGYRVTYVRNYTDVDDKIIQRAQATGISPKALAENMIASTDEDMLAIGVRAPTYAPKVSLMITQIIAMIQRLISNSAAYATADGDVYYRVHCKHDYGKLSNRKPDEMRSGTRDIVQGQKEDELDFALWKADTTADASWESPWGRGRPGWHIECSAMAKEYLGDAFDIHGGGRDLIFPHHENEIAQSESANQTAYATVWIHCGLLTLNKQKMSKSLGNQIGIKDFLQQWPAEILRLGFLQHHYSSNIDFSEAVFRNCHRSLLYYYRTLRDLDALATESSENAPLLPGYDPEEVRKAFHRFMSDDFNSAGAIGDMNRFFAKANELLVGKRGAAKSATARTMAAVLREVFGVCGLLNRDPASAVADLKLRLLPELGITEEQIAQFIRDRRTAREAKDFARADVIRKELAERGIELMDNATGTDWGIKYQLS